MVELARRVTCVSENEMQKLFSRKLGITLATLLGVVFQIQDPVTALVAGAVSIAYVLAQARIDKAEVERVAKAAELGLSEARKASDGSTETQGS